MERDDIDIDVRLLHYWLANNQREEIYQEEHEIRCECGGDKTNTGHSMWCPKFIGL